MLQIKAALRAWSRRLKQPQSPVAPAAPSAAVARYLAGPREPWSDGYWEYRQQVTAATLHNAELLRRFRTGQALPAGYGARLDERTVEYPWALSRLAERSGSVLDAGGTLSYRYLLKLPALSSRRVLICSLTMDSEYRPRPNVGYLLADLRRAPLAAASVDNIVCLSTLEHVGMDNTQVYGSFGAGEHYREHVPTAYRLVLNEFRRLLAPNGRLYLSVPFGAPEQLGWLQQFDQAMIDDVITTFAGRAEEVNYFRYSADGWQPATAAACRTARYFDVHQGTGFDPDYAAAARAVACLVLTNTV